MADHIEDAIHKISNVVKHGKLKHKKIKLKTDVAKNVEKEISKVLNDNVTKEERDRICRKARQDAHKPVADMKRDVSNDVRKDLGLE